MKLKKVLLNCESKDFAEIEISDLCHEADNVKRGSLFFCLRGSTFDGHDFAALAAENGAAAVVCEREVKASCPQIIVEDTRVVFATSAAAFYGNPANELKTFGITGTNGKTTTSYILAEILREAGEEVGLIGTNCIRYRDVCIPATLTTPDPILLNRTLREMRDVGVTAVVMEVSAHALALSKTRGIVFDVAGFTNFSRDHLDFFGSMDEYAEAKLRLFDLNYAKCAAINADDELGIKILQSGKIPMIAYGMENPADVFGIDLTMSAEGIRYVINSNDDIGDVKFALPGRFNAYNTLCAAAMASLAGVKLKSVLAGIKSLKRVDGRFNVINADKFSVIVDFAHTDDGLRNIITSVREFATARIITVFGCGGNRDKTKRKAMGKVVSELSDLTVVTSDNPRDEEPMDIINDALAGVAPENKNAVFVEPDRQKAIEYAITLADDGDIIIVAGKGAERYQEIKGVKHAYNDEEFIMKILQSGREND